MILLFNPAAAAATAGTRFQSITSSNCICIGAHPINGSDIANWFPVGNYYWPEWVAPRILFNSGSLITNISSRWRFPLQEWMSWLRGGWTSVRLPCPSSFYVLVLLLLRLSERYPSNGLAVRAGERNVMELCINLCRDSISIFISDFPSNHRRTIFLEYCLTTTFPPINWYSLLCCTIGWDKGLYPVLNRDSSIKLEFNLLEINK